MSATTPGPAPPTGATSDRGPCGEALAESKARPVRGKTGPPNHDPAVSQRLAGIVAVGATLAKYSFRTAGTGIGP